jgi:hypothetical protein
MLSASGAKADCRPAGEWLIIIVEAQTRFAITDLSRTGLLVCIKCLGLLIRILTAHIIGGQ